MTPAEQTPSETPPGRWRQLFMSPYINWLWLAPMFAAVVWGMSTWETQAERAAATLLTALLAMGFTRQVVLVAQPSELTPAIRLHTALVMGLWFGLFSLLQRGPEEAGKMLVDFTIMGATFGGLMALFMKADARLTAYWQAESSFQRGGLQAQAARWWPVLGLAVMLVGLTWGWSLLATGFAVTLLYLVAPPFRRRLPPKGRGEALALMAYRIVTLVLILGLVWLLFGPFAALSTGGR